MKTFIPLLITLLLLQSLATVQAQVRLFSEVKNPGGYFAIHSSTSTPVILYDTADKHLVGISARLLADDIEKVTGNRPAVSKTEKNAGTELVIIGSIGNSRFIDAMVQAGKLDVSPIRDQWERFIIQTVKNPLPGIKQALVIAGSDRRGAAYGVFTLSGEMGISPWYWWADVPPKRMQGLFIRKDRYVSDGPSVKYRGIFINDEAPALRGWAEQKFGGFNREFYVRVYEMILRNKGNFLWPAMWRPTAFADDDPGNAAAADEWGIVISTSHHEPMMRAHDEWSRFDGGDWNYITNKEKLREFWRGGIQRMGDYESLVTMGMRGDGDEAMTEETAVDLMKTIIADQRGIIADVTRKPADQTPQVWAVYKEVQDYYDKGLRVDDDILVLFCDDNWGNVRILPKKAARDHPGGYGMYYHFDFVGGPVSYRWLNVTQIEKIWEQMNLAYEWGVRDLWLVNVGDIKPMELPISFFLDFGWDATMNASDLPQYYSAWASQQFGDEYAREIGYILKMYTKYNARRTPEMLSPETYSLFNYREAENVVADYDSLVSLGEKIYEMLPSHQRDAFYQLVLSPVLFCSNLNKMYVAAGKNQHYASQGAISANYYADQVIECFERDAELTRYFHEELADGKWNHMMAQTHIGYTSWNNPPANRMPAVSFIQPEENSFGFSIEAGVPNRSQGIFARSFSTFDPANNQEYYIELFNRGTTGIPYTLSAEEDWIILSSTSGILDREERIYVKIDWQHAPEGNATGSILLKANGSEFSIDVPVNNSLPALSGFIENNGVVSMEAAHFTRKINNGDAGWTIIPNLGRTYSAVTIEPSSTAPREDQENAPRIEYEFTLFEGAEIKIKTYVSPTLNFRKNEGLKFAIAIDNEPPKIINLHEGETAPDWEYPEWWNKSVTDHIKILHSAHGELTPGTHTLKVWMIDPGVVFQKFVIDAGGLRQSYLGPPESRYVEPGNKGSN